MPNFDTYPSPSNSAMGNSPPVNAPLGVLNFAQQSNLEIRAARVGAALGQFVLLLRNQKDVAVQKLSVVTEEATAALSQTADSVRGRAEEAGQAASNKAQELWTEAERRAEQLRDRSVLKLKRAQVRAQEFQRDNPEQVAIGVGALGVALGIGLRIWRANRA